MWRRAVPGALLFSILRDNPLTNRMTSVVTYIIIGKTGEQKTPVFSYVLEDSGFIVGGDKNFLIISEKGLCGRDREGILEISKKCIE